MIERMSIYEFRQRPIYYHIINNLECWKYDGSEKIIEKLFNGEKLDDDVIILCQCDETYYVKDGKNILYSVKGFMQDVFEYKGEFFTDIYSKDMHGINGILKNAYIKVEIIEGDKNELSRIIDSERKIYDSILYERMLSVEDSLQDTNMRWCILETVLLENEGLKPMVIKDFDSKLEAWNYAKENEEDVRNNDNIIVYKIGLLKKIGNKYELERDSHAIKTYQIIKVMKGK